MKKALITGITGQDGSYLAELLLDKGYEVHGIVRRSSVHTTNRIDHLLSEGSIILHDGDLTDSSSIIRIVGEVRPDEIYNLAAQSHVGVSFDASCASSKLFICWAWISPAGFTKLRQASCMARLKRFPRMRTPRFIRTARMRSPNSTAFG